MLLECFSTFATNTEYTKTQQDFLKDLMSKLDDSLLQFNFNSKLSKLSPKAFDLKHENVEITPAKLYRSELALVNIHQNEHYASEKAILRRKEKLPNNNSLLKLDPILDGEILRVGGRLENSDIQEETKHPLILYPYDYLTRWLIFETHKELLHAGLQLTLTTLRWKYWIVKGRSAVKSVLNKCFTCKRYSGKPCSQQMGHLPSPRVTANKPFFKAGIDYAGPIKVRLSKTRGNVTQKGYIAIYVCMSTRTIHLEVVEDYFSQAYIAAFQRFVSRRGYCAHLTSDRGTNFVGADAELREMLNKLFASFEEVFRQLAAMGTEWHFHPAKAPHFGGLWEAGVKSVKWHLRRVIGEQVLTFIEMSTLLCKIKAIMNSRPMLPLTDDISELGPLTPSHFLIQRSCFAVPEPDYRDEKIPLGKRWQMVSQMAQHFWDRWTKENLTSLQMRNKWLRPQRSLEIGDLVAVIKETTPPCQWPLGLMTDTHPGPDGLVRAVTIRTANSQFQRPSVQVLLLAKAHELKNKDK